MARCRDARRCRPGHDHSAPQSRPRLSRKPASTSWSGASRCRPNRSLLPNWQTDRRFPRPHHRAAQHNRSVDTDRFDLMPGRETVAPQHKNESGADAGRRCTQNTLMLQCGSKTVDHASISMDGRAAGIESQAAPRPVPIRVFCVHRLPASALKFLLCGAADRFWRTHPAPYDLGGARVWRRVLVAANGCAM
jgi:hypothetical protein